MTYGELKEKYNSYAFTKVAGEDIKGSFGRKGWSLYGNTDNMHVMSYEIKGNVVHAVLGNSK